MQHIVHKETGYLLMWLSPKKVATVVEHHESFDDTRRAARVFTSSLVKDIVFDDFMKDVKAAFGINEVCNVFVFDCAEKISVGQWDFVPNPPH